MQKKRLLKLTSSLSYDSDRGCSVDWEIEGSNLRCTVTVRTHWRTGVEMMEALCGVNAGLLCAWDMLKSVEKDSEGQYPDSESMEFKY